MYGILFLLVEIYPVIAGAEPGLGAWAPAFGLHLSVLVVFGGRYVPVVFVAALAGGLLSAPSSASVGVLLLTSLLVVGGQGAAAVWLRRVLKRDSFQAGPFVMSLAGVAILLPAFIALGMELVSLLSSGPGVDELSFAQQWIGGSIGILMVAPLLLLGTLLSDQVRDRAVLQQTREALALRLETVTQAMEETRHDLEAAHQERQRIEASLGASIDELKASRHELETSIGHQQQLNDKLRTSEKDLSDLNARKDKFFSIISHDVKSMLVSAIGFSKLLIGDAETLPREMIKEFAAHIHSSTTNTYDLLENLLTWTRMQTGRMYYQRSWHTVNDLIENNITMLKSNAARKGIQLNRQGDRDAQVYADRNMINSVLQNLISNAIKFTMEGGEITVSSYPRDHTVEIAVTDTGVGISSENLGKLFRIDVNHSTRGTDDEEGTGLGLVLCKEMIEKHEGEIWAESEPGKGSSFRFTLPCAMEGEAA